MYNSSCVYALDHTISSKKDAQLQVLVASLALYAGKNNKMVSYIRKRIEAIKEQQQQQEKLEKKDDSLGNELSLHNKQRPRQSRIRSASMRKSTKTTSTKSSSVEATKSPKTDKKSRQRSSRTLSSSRKKDGSLAATETERTGSSRDMSIYKIDANTPYHVPTKIYFSSDYCDDIDESLELGMNGVEDEIEDL